MAPTTVDEYTAGFPPEIQDIIIKIRAVIKESAPGVEEKISYGMPAYILGDGLLSFAVWKQHVGFYPMTGGMMADPELARLKGTKSSIHIPLNQPIPYGLIRKMVEIRQLEIRAR